MEYSERVKKLLSFLVSKNQSSQEKIDINELCIGLIKSDTMIQELLKDEDIDITQLQNISQESCHIYVCR